MKKKFLVTAIGLIIVVVFTACGKSSIDNTSPVETQNSEVVNNTETEKPPNTPILNVPIEKSIIYSNGAIEYSIPESWIERGSTESMKRYYPEQGSLQIGTEEIEISITDDKSRKEFMEGVFSGFDKYELLSEKKIIISENIAYRFDINLITSGKKYRASLVIFDYSKGINLLMMSTPEESNKRYDNEFENILSSIRLTDEALIEEKAPTEDDGIISFKTDNFFIVYSHHETGKDFQGKPALYYYYTFTNTSSNNQSAAFSASIKAFQNGVESSTAISLEGRPEIQNYLKEVQPGGTINVCQVYELTDTSDVTIEAEVLISFGDFKDIQIIPLK